MIGDPKGDELESLGAEAATARLVTRLVDYPIAALVAVAWLVPLAVVGLTLRGVVNEPYLNWLHHDARLFADRTPVWWVYHVEALPGDRDEWFSLPYDDYTPMEPFGRVTRLDRIIERWVLLSQNTETPARHLEKARDQQREMARWVARRHASLHPGAPSLRAVRFVGTYFPLEDLADPEGPWVTVDFDAVPKERKMLVGLQVLNDGEAK